MGHIVLDRIPARGITKEEHDRHVALTGRSFTDPFIVGRLSSHSPDGGAVPTAVVMPKRPSRSRK